MTEVAEFSRFEVEIRAAAGISTETTKNAQTVEARARVACNIWGLEDEKTGFISNARSARTTEYLHIKAESQQDGSCVGVDVVNLGPELSELQARNFGSVVAKILDLRGPAHLNKYDRAVVYAQPHFKPSKKEPREFPVAYIFGVPEFLAFSQSGVALSQWAELSATTQFVVAHHEWGHARQFTREAWSEEELNGYGWTRNPVSVTVRSGYQMGRSEWKQRDHKISEVAAHLAGDHDYMKRMPLEYVAQMEAILMTNPRLLLERVERLGQSAEAKFAQRIVDHAVGEGRTIEDFVDYDDSALTEGDSYEITRLSREELSDLGLLTPGDLSLYPQYLQHQVV